LYWYCQENSQGDKSLVKIISVCTLFLLLLAQPVWGVTTQPERTVLTLELLQERLRSPTKREGIPTLDLQQMVIDLRPENAEFRDSFYQLLRTQLQRAGSNPLGLDLSYSLIQGDLAGSDLGLQRFSIGWSIATAGSEPANNILGGHCSKSIRNRLV